MYETLFSIPQNIFYFILYAEIYQTGIKPSSQNMYAPGNLKKKKKKKNPEGTTHHLTLGWLSVNETLWTPQWYLIDMSNI